MLIPFLLASLATATTIQQTDTVIPVSAGARLDVELMRGALVVRSWDRQEVRVVSSNGTVDVRRTNGLVKVRPDIGADMQGHGNPMMHHDLEITVPRDMSIEAGGTFLSADLEGVGGEVRLETTNGHLRVRGGRTFIQLHTVQGAVELEGAEGRVELHATNGPVTATDIAGDVQASAINGHVALRSVRSGSVEASTVNGGIEYTGAIERGGRYVFDSHAGDISVAIPASAGVALTASTFGGSFDSAFPVTLEKMEGGQTLSFTLGDGSAHMELTSFSGTIRLRRP
jgi:DUF4097 and DUF4098 domain-containing protein YvlB